MPTDDHSRVQRFVSARHDPERVVVEGFHAVKHALRFGAQPTEVVVAAGTDPAALPSELAAADVAVDEVPGALFDRLVPRRPPVPVVALTPRPADDAHDVLRAGGDVVVLEAPSHAGNAGAAVRVAAAAGAGGLLVVGRLDPWSPAAVRGAAGLQFALPVARADALPTVERPVVVFDDRGVPLTGTALPEQALLVFGSERRGVSPRIRRRADLVVAIPMRPGVSSLNLATAVAVGCYARALRPPR